jgi:hypothetical protein
LWNEVNAETGIEAIDFIFTSIADDDETDESETNNRLFGEAINHLKLVCEKYNIDKKLTLYEICDILMTKITDC